MTVTRNDNGRSPGADPQVTAVLRAHYEAPAGEAYWGELEQSIMQRLATATSGVVRELRPSWWSGFAELRGADMRAVASVAATIALLAAGAAFVRGQAASARARELAARAAVETAMPLPIDGSTLTGGRRHLPKDAPERYLNPLDY
ncbi:hypothetical protein [Gemmatimonas sp.]|uniref:hypothetical protein n=1 Tax=Gemmatimonas sp. TaxID=1962908 RepID=UPI0022CA669D|nr:hypothetical protein [Gemmatimonas sp.]MCZ8204048.1 hypothetical protein [Gemmatimonas sp.]